MLQEGKARMKAKDEGRAVFLIVSSEAYVHCLKTDFEIWSVFELEQENSFFSSFGSDLHPKQIWMGAPPELLRTWRKCLSPG